MIIIFDDHGLKYIFLTAHYIYDILFIYYLNFFIKQNHSLFKNHTFLNKLEDSFVFPVENCSPSEETILLCDAASWCPCCTGAGELLHSAHAAQDSTEIPGSFNLGQGSV